MHPGALHSSPSSSFPPPTHLSARSPAFLPTYLPTYRRDLDPARSRNFRPATNGRTGGSLVRIMPRTLSTAEISLSPFPSFYSFPVLLPAPAKRDLRARARAREARARFSTNREPRETERIEEHEREDVEDTTTDARTLFINQRRTPRQTRDAFSSRTCSSTLERISNTPPRERLRGRREHERNSILRFSSRSRRLRDCNWGGGYWRTGGGEKIRFKGNHSKPSVGDEIAEIVAASRLLIASFGWRIIPRREAERER